MTLLDQRSIDARKQALNMAIATHEGRGASPRTTLDTAKEYFDFMTGAEGDAPEPATMVVQFRAPSGMPDDWTGPAPLPADTLNSVIAQEVSTTELQELRRQKLFELDVISSALRTRGVVPN